jgi:hypothetical protein
VLPARRRWISVDTNWENSGIEIPLVQEEGDRIVRAYVVFGYFFTAGLFAVVARDYVTPMILSYRKAGGGYALGIIGVAIVCGIIGFNVDCLAF